jgi:ELWxxDGT repeat protein
LFTDVNGTAFFFADNGTTGRELWKTDGTAAGTTLVKDINPGSADSVPDYYEGVKPTVLNGILYFAASDGVAVQELWRSDGTAAGTYMLKNVSPAYALSGTIGTIKATTDRVYYTSYIYGQGTELYASDGTAAGTGLVKDIYAGSASSSPDQFTAVGNTLYFVATSAGSGRELWKSTGTAASTVLVKDLTPGTGNSYLQNMTASGGKVFFSFNTAAAGYELWASDGTAAGTALVKDIRAGTGSGNPTGLTDVAGTLFFAADNGTNGRELWKSDGTAAGTVMVKDIEPTVSGTYAYSSSPYNLIAVGNRLFFSAYTLANGTELYVSDGSAAGTALVTNLTPGSGSSTLASFTNVSGTLYFTSYDYTTGNSKLYTSDGTAAGTTFVEIIAGYGPKLVASGGKAYYSESAPLTGAEPSVSNGTAAGTGNIVDLNPTAASSNPSEITAFGDSVFFAADNPFLGREMWVQNVDEVMQVSNAPGTAGTDPFNAFVASNRLWFFGFADGNVYQGSTPALFSTNEYGDDTETVYSFDELGYYYGGRYAIHWSEVTQIGDLGFFTVAIYDTSYDYDLVETQLWVVDGPQYDVYQADTAYEIGDLAEFNGELHYARDGDLYKLAYDVTPTLVADVFPGGYSRIYEMEEFNNKLYFSAYTAGPGGVGTELYASDGTQAGTGLVADIVPGVNGSNPYNLTATPGNLFFTISSPYGAEELWKVDLTGAVSAVKDVNPGTGAGIANLTYSGGLLYFTANDGTSGTELWVSDGTALGTTLVADLNPGSAGSSPVALTDVNGTLYFVASTPTTGRELYKIVGGAPVLVEDINPGAADGFAVGTGYGIELVLKDDELYFAADDGTTGTELYSIAV